MSIFATPLATSFTTFIPILRVFGGCLGLLAFGLLTLEFITLAFLYVTFVFVVTTFATIATGDGTPEMILMGHRFPILGMLLSRTAGVSYRKRCRTLRVAASCLSASISVLCPTTASSFRFSWLVGFVFWSMRASSTL